MSHKEKEVAKEGRRGREGWTERFPSRVHADHTETHFPNKSCAIFIPLTSPGTATASPPCRRGVEKRMQGR